MFTLSQINVFPVKSLDGYSPSEAIVEPQGLQYDRRWLITDEEGMFLTRRTIRKMTGLRAEIAGDWLRIASKTDANNSIRIGIYESSGSLNVKVWDDRVKAFSVSTTADDFLSDFLGVKCRLVKLDDKADRQIDRKYAPEGAFVSFADAFPFMIIGSSSFADLNTRLENKLQSCSARFRPNFVFEGGLPYCEDYWKMVKIGDTIFSGRKNCGRCVMINVDPDTGESSSEPLNTLASYRKSGNSIQLGRHMCLGSPFRTKAEYSYVRVGDEIEVLTVS